MKIYGDLYVDMCGMIYEIGNLDGTEVIIYDVNIEANVRFEEKL